MNCENMEICKMWNHEKYDVVVIGGGLSGILAAIRLTKKEMKVLIVDQGLAASEGKLGGFASFSGAKFSLPPAGMGLLPLVGSVDEFQLKIREVIEELGLNNSHVQYSKDIQTEPEKPIGLNSFIRSYGSIVLSPSEINSLISELYSKIEHSCDLIRGKALGINRSNSCWNVSISKLGSAESVIVRTDAIFYAAGRLSSGILIDAGASVLPGKGVDVGVRFEFLDRVAVNGLRALGADAKIISGNCRTFCLNSPGKIYRYPLGDIKVPGGVVASEFESSANFGVLLRLDGKESVLKSVVRKVKELEEDVYHTSEKINRGFPFGDTEKIMKFIYSDEIVTELQVFCQEIGRLNLVDWSSDYKIHLPLIDWHWSTFSMKNTHKTTLHKVYALGDSSGHARGLLQASLSGWLAAEEYINEN